MTEDNPPRPQSPRIVVVGAKRRHQGLGFHLCRFLHEAGARVVGIVGTSPGSVSEALAGLAEIGLQPAGGTDAEHLVRTLQPNALVVASPSGTHDTYLRLGLEHGLHVLCEKPLCWGGSGAADRAETSARAYEERGLHLVVNAQWPYTLDTWRALFPGVLDASPERFWMRLSPDSSGEAMIPDALPHALSLLLAVVPHETPSVEDVRIRVLGEDEGRMEVRFTYRAGPEAVEATVDLRRGGTQPRAAGYGFDGRQARRRIRLADYRLWLEGAGRSVALPDPTPRLVRSFVARVSSPTIAACDPNAWPGMGLLETIHTAWPKA